MLLLELLETGQEPRPLAAGNRHLGRLEDSPQLGSRGVDNPGRQDPAGDAGEDIVLDEIGRTALGTAAEHRTPVVAPFRAALHMRLPAHPGTAPAVEQAPEDVVSIEAVSSFLDHSSLAVTSVYLRRLEDTFTEGERIVAPWIRHLRAVDQPGRMSLDAVVRDGLAGYLAMLYVRSPVFREPNRKMATFLESIRIDMLLANPDAYVARVRQNGHHGTDAEIEAERQLELLRFRSGEIFVEAPAQWSLVHLKTALDGIRPVLVDMHWTLVRRESSPFLVLGDQPVTLLGPQGELGEIGFANDDVDVLVPLSASSLLMMTKEPHQGGIDVIAPDDRGQADLGPRWWHLANSAAWRTAARFVFARSASDLQGSELSLDPSDRRSTLPGPSYRGGNPPWTAYAERIGIQTISDEDL